ncbi:MAG: hypothetical protein BWK80_62830 [Desulfobacteraceae bacterium IS3]|nr:MAG: hypothetical protein BWK80_62830 [Desulfobacteraceae bacterium IS3]
MAQMSSPESALKRVEELHKKIEELYETVNLIKQIRAKFDKSYQEAKDKIREIDKLEESCKNNTDNLRGLMEISELTLRSKK